MECCPQCDETGKYDNKNSLECVCFQGHLDQVAVDYKFFYGSQGDDCIHITDSNAYYVLGYKGNDVIVIEGDGTKHVYGDYDERSRGDGNDVITIVGHNTKYVFGGGGDDVITITGDYAGMYRSERGISSGLITGDAGKDTIIINGQS